MSPCLAQPAQDTKLFNLMAKNFTDAYPAVYQSLYQAKSVTCSVTGAIFDAIPPPSAVILDVSLLMLYAQQWYQLIIYFQFFAFPQLLATRAVSGRSVPIIAFIAAGAGAIIRFFGPESIGGTGDYGAKIDAEIARTGLSDEEIGPKVDIFVSFFWDGHN